MSGETLTLDVMLQAYDRLWDLPDEPHWYLCHPDDLARLRSHFAEERWGTCPLIRARSFMQPGKVYQIKHNVDRPWQWPWQRRKE